MYYWTKLQGCIYAMIVGDSSNRTNVKYFYSCNTFEFYGREHVEILASAKAHYRSNFPNKGSVKRRSWAKLDNRGFGTEFCYDQYSSSCGNHYSYYLRNKKWSLVASLPLILDNATIGSPR